MYVLQNMYLSPLVWLLASSFVCAKRPFDVMLEAYECFSNPVYVEYMNCVVDRKLNLGTFSLRVGRELTNPRFSFDVVLYKNNNENNTLFNVTDGDGCAFLEGKTRVTLLNIARTVLDKGGFLPPKCPISKDLLLEYKNMSIDVEQFPQYLPETKFCVNITSTQQGDLVFNMQIFGEVVYKTAKKWWG